MIGDIMQPTHLLFVLVIALLVLGPKRLPEVGRSLGRGLRDFRAAMSGEDDEPVPAVPTQNAASTLQPTAPLEPSAAAAPAGPAPATEQAGPIAPTAPVHAAPEGPPTAPQAPPAAAPPAAAPEPAASEPSGPEPTEHHSS